MADLLDSLLPADYMAPSVQGILGGILDYTLACVWGNVPNCSVGTSPYCPPCDPGSTPWTMCEPDGIGP